MPVVNVCAISQCRRDAAALYTWGLYPDGTRNTREPLCEVHARELWEAVKGPVSAGLMHYAIDPCPTS